MIPNQFRPWAEELDPWLPKTTKKFIHTPVSGSPPWPPDYSLHYTILMHLNTSSICQFHWYFNPFYRCLTWDSWSSWRFNGRWIQGRVRRDIQHGEMFAEPDASESGVHPVTVAHHAGVVHTHTGTRIHVTTQRSAYGKDVPKDWERSYQVSQSY